MKRNTKKSTKRKKTHKLAKDKDIREGSFVKAALNNFKHLQKKHKIVDVPFSDKNSVGTEATCGDIDFHYQNYSNVMDFFHVIDHPSTCFFSEGKAFLSLKIEDMKKGVHPLEHDFVSFRKNLMNCVESKNRFTPVILNLITDDGNHANILLIDTRDKLVELYEPHGARPSSSCLGGVVGAYRKKIAVIRRFWKEILPKFKVINAVDYRKGTAFQMEHDPENHTGFCVSWTILFVHYRLLNPHVELPTLIKYISYRITTSKLLRYAKYIEDNIKGKI
jgi:hypothetical protein